LARQTQSGVGAVDAAGANLAKRVVLTRPAERQRALAQRLRDVGCEVLELPALTIEAVGPAQQPSALSNGLSDEVTAPVNDEQLAKPLGPDTALLHSWQPDQFDAVVWVSRGAWQHYADWYLQRPQVSLLQSLEQTAKTATTNNPEQAAREPVLACVGVATARQVADGLQLPLQAITYPDGDLSSDSEGLWAILQRKLQRGDRVLIVRGQTGRDWLADTMTDHGMNVTCLSVYQRRAAVWQPEQVQTLMHWGASGQGSGAATALGNLAGTGVWLITSAEGLAAIQAQYQQHQLMGKPGLQPQAVVVVHQRLVPLVHGWLSHWGQDELPLVVTAPEDEAIFKAIVGNLV